MELNGKNGCKSSLLCIMAETLDIRGNKDELVNKLGCLIRSPFGDRLKYLSSIT